MTSSPATDRGAYAVVTAAYWAFTLTDGALRMLVLLHFHAAGFTPVTLAFLFLLYEAMGIVTNALGGWLGARHGLRLTLFAGLSVQVVALLALSFTDPGWTLALSVAWVMGAQALSGIAKDLTKMASKAAVKTVVGEAAGQGVLFRWIALLTGSKNALKGVGFFLGGALLAGLGFAGALWAMAAGLALVLAAGLLLLRHDLGKAKAKPGRGALFANSAAINWLSAARVALFAARDVWFVVGVPVFLASVLGWGFHQVGAFMAVWVIGYGIVQAAVPSVLRRTRDATAGGRAAVAWGGGLAVLTAGLALAMSLEAPPLPPGPLLVGGLLAFGVVFAVNSAVHSWLIVAHAEAERVALAVGFYYAANAVGRFIGTLLSGVLYQVAGLEGTLWASAGLALAATLLALPLARPEARSPA